MSPFVLFLIQQSPEIVAAVKAIFAKHNPDALPLTDDEVRAGLLVALSTSLATDQGWLDSHPPAAGPSTSDSDQ